ncbi:MAG: DUF4864 domain-containing protein [Pseudomonadota bacterium]
MTLPRLLAIAAAMILSLAPLRAEEPAETIQSVISDQIDAFQRSDLPAAFAHASPSIQSIFGSPERFGQMVRGGYPMIWRPSRFEMLKLLPGPGLQVQTVLFEAQDGSLYEADYEMIEIDGVWRINGVALRKLPGVAS